MHGGDVEPIALNSREVLHSSRSLLFRKQAMAKHIESHKSMGTGGDVVLVRLLDKQLIAPEKIQETSSEIAALIDDQHKKFVVSFSQVELFSTAVLNVLLSLKKDLDKKSGGIRVACVGPGLREAFRIPGLDKVFSLKETEKEALADF